MSGAAAGREPRNIILLSDGTGASSMSFNKSNVWRVFTTLDLGPDYHQIAYYDDGVGTSGIKWLRALGGGFGWGLSRNVRQMYEFLCRHYREGDRIYIFGFSRGAFTARVLAHFIGVCGILDRKQIAPGASGQTMETDRGLKRGTRQAYKSYRRSYWDRAWWPQRLLAAIGRSIRNLFPCLAVLPASQFKENYSLHEKRKYPIEFIGIWDTVDAVGLPIDELSDLLDRFIRPYKFPDRKFSPYVARACHALAIDDERHTFHPLLWDETGVEDRVKQVWFAGMHSNVGGGYPEDNLAYVALDWMISEVAALTPDKGLVFNEQKRKVTQQRAEPIGKLYDSRRGAAVFYRYRPRSIAALSEERVRGGQVSTEVPKIHHSVISRIKDSQVGYSSAGLPAHFVVVEKDRSVREFTEESDDDRTLRSGLLRRVEDHVTWRRVNYVCLLLATYGILSMPLYKPAIPGWESAGDGVRAKLSDWLAGGFGYAAGIIPDVMPDFAAYWTNAWTQSPILFLAFVAIFAVIFVWNRWVVGNIQVLSEAAWWHVKGNRGARPIRPLGIFEQFAHSVRTSFVGRGFDRVIMRVVVPVAFTLICAYLFFGVGYRLLIHEPFVEGGVCALAEAGTPKMQPASGTEPAAATVGGRFQTSDPCFDTGIDLIAGKRYEVVLTGDTTWDATFRQSRLWTDTFCRKDNSGSSWKDAGHPATFKGLSCIWARFRFTFLFSVPARRHLLIPWFTLVGEVGKDSGSVFPLNEPHFVFRPASDGRLFLHVSDGIDPLGIAKGQCNDETVAKESHWRCLYTNNSGSAIVEFGPVGPLRTGPPRPPEETPIISIHEVAE
jgi:hypothetical protein